MSLRVAFDLDGTLANMTAAITQIARVLFGANGESAAPRNGHPDPADGPLPHLDTLTAHQQSALWTHVENTKDFWMSLTETEPGIVARIATAARARRWEVIFITTRPATPGDTTQRQTQRWLEAHGFSRPSVFVVTNSRGKVADALTLDAVVDDHLENAVDVAVQSNAKSILVRDGDAEAVPPHAVRLGVTVVSGVSEALAVLERLDEIRRKPGMLKSIKQMLTLRA
jgi:hypothetical protein